MPSLSSVGWTDLSYVGEVTCAGRDGAVATAIDGVAGC
jgi:hypothetical protein